MSESYVHGHDPRENARLQDQAGSVLDLLQVEGIREPALAAALIEPGTFATSVRDLSRTTVFCNTFFKGLGEKKAE